MKILQTLALASLISLGLVGCSTPDPRITGKLGDWRGRPSSMLVQFQGEPQRVLKDPDGSEIWEYLRAGDMVIPKGESTSFFGRGSDYGFGASFSSEKRPEDHTARVEDTMRFKIRQDIITGVFASRVVDGRIVRQDHW